MASHQQTATSSPEETQSPPEAVNLLLQHLGELNAYLEYFVRAKFDGVRLSARRVAVWMTVGCMGLIATASVIVTAIVLLLTGLAMGLAAVFDDRLWLGNILVGLGLLALVSVGLWGITRYSHNTSYKRTLQWYWQQRLRQHAVFGQALASTTSAPSAGPDEAAFLTQQAAAAKAAMRHTLAEMRETARTAADLPAWTQQFPWVAVAAAAIVGFATATTLTTNPSASDSTTTKGHSTLTSSLVLSLMAMIKGSIIKALMALIQDYLEPPEGPPNDEATATVDTDSVTAA